MDMQKGQAAVELLIILAVSMTVLIAIYSYSFDSMAWLNRQKLVDQAQTSVNILARSADDVYRQGLGARKKVFFTVPGSVDQSKSGIESDSFVLNVLGSDVYSKPNACLLGEMPTGSGGHWVWLTAREECVFVGVEKVEVDKTSSYVTISQSDLEEDSVTVTNNGPGSATIFVTKTWPHSDVTLDISSETFSLAEEGQQVVTLTYTSNASAAGNYAGSVKVNAYFADSADENIFLPANAEIVVLETDLLLFPATYAATLRENDVQTADLNVCNNSGLALTNISFSDSGEIAAWIAAIDSIASLAAGSCVTASFTITVPSGQSPGSYGGTITAIDDSGNTDSTEVTATIPEMAGDFGFDWSTALFSADGKRLWEWTIENNGDDTITIDEMAVSWWNDADGSTLGTIRLNNTLVWSAGSGSSGQLLDITDFDLGAGSSYSSNNRLEFSRKMDDDSEDFQITFTFTDSSTYTTAVYAP